MSFFSTERESKHGQGGIREGGRAEGIGERKYDTGSMPSTEPHLGLYLMAWRS